MRAYLAGVLIENAEERLEILEMLEQLVTVSGTRNIIERTRLIEAMFRDARPQGDDCSTASSKPRSCAVKCDTAASSWR